MKIVTLWYQGTYAQNLEVPDDFDPTVDNLLALAEENQGEIDWSDGGASWCLCTAETPKGIVELDY